MGSQSAYSRGRLGPFLIKMLDSGKIQGLEWLNREDKLFKMLWIDKRKTARSSYSEANPIFKEWEIYNHRHKEGDKEDPNRWKQTFRGALNRSPDVHEELEMSNELRPYKVFRFADGIKMKTLDYSLYSRNEKQLNSLNKGHGFYHQGNTSTETEIDPKQTNIPKVVTDELYRTDMYVNSVNKMPSSMTTPRVPKPQILEMEMDQHQMEFNAPNIASPDSDLEYRLDSDEFCNYFQGCSSMDFSSLPSFNTPDNSLGCDKPLVKFQVYYSDNIVLKDEIKNSGICLFFGSKPEGNYPNLFGPEDFKQVKLPDVRKFESTMNVKDSKLIHVESILEKMCRGLLLYCNDRGLFALRLCTTRIFAWNNLTGLIVLDRKKKIEHQLFDMNIFEAQMNLHKSNPQTYFCPSPTVTLTFGQEYDPRNKSKNFLVHVELTFVEAERLFQKEISNDLQFSALDSGDVLLNEHLKKVNIRE